MSTNSYNASQDDNTVMVHNEQVDPIGVLHLPYCNSLAIRKLFEYFC